MHQLFLRWEAPPQIPTPPVACPPTATNGAGPANPPNSSTASAIFSAVSPNPDRKLIMHMAFSNGPQETSLIVSSGGALELSRPDREDGLIPFTHCLLQGKRRIVS